MTTQRPSRALGAVASEASGSSYQPLNYGSAGTTLTGQRRDIASGEDAAEVSSLASIPS
jgi:hypothetical protein